MSCPTSQTAVGVGKRTRNDCGSNSVIGGQTTAVGPSEAAGIQQEQA
jgi:hypothetical protein